MTKLQQELLVNATKYLDNGWSVLPTHNKRPILRKWKRYQNELPTHSNLKSWFRKKDVTGISIITGELSNIVVIDVDPDKGGTFEELDKYETLTALSGNYGKHYYFRPNDSEDLKSSHFQGFDIQGNGQNIVAPPSIHENGNRYKWAPNHLTVEIKSFPKDFKLSLLNLKNNKKRIKDSPIIKPKITKPTFEGLIPENIINEINNIPIADVINSVGLTIPVHKEYQLILCPFHSDREPSFSVYSLENFAQCFGCGRSFNNITFIQNYLSLTFPESCNYLLNKFGINHD